MVKAYENGERFDRRAIVMILKRNGEEQTFGNINLFIYLDNVLQF